MKFYQSFILFSLFTLAFVSCNTDDLERDIDALKDRVASFETQVQQLNDEMNIIRVLLDGNKTITDYSIDGDTYTLTLSNGETLTLTPGVVGGNYPSIEIGENGNWFIGDEDTGKRAKAENGNDAEITPQFKIEANPADGDKKYWYVSYDEGKNWSVLENGCAEGTNTSENPIESAVVEGDNFKVVLSDGSEHFIPIVQGLECAINIPEGVTDGLWSVAGGGQSSFKVKVKLAEGDLVRVNAPADWNAKVSKYQVGDTEVSVTVTPPSTPSECIIVVEVTHGVNTATDQIKARTTSDSYWAEYQAGLDIKIGDVVINKYNNPEGKLLQDGSAILISGVYFIAQEATVEWTSGAGDLIIISENKNNYSSLNMNSTVQLDGSGSILLSGLKLRCAVGATSFKVVSGSTKRLTLNHCDIEMQKDKVFAEFDNTENAANLDEIVMESCRVSVPVPTVSTSVINLFSCKGKYDKVLIHNNIFYCREENSSVLYCFLNNTASINNIDIENNTIINLLSNHGSNSGYVRLPINQATVMKNNLIWYDTNCYGEKGQTTTVTLVSSISEGAAFGPADFESNKVFTAVDGKEQLTWKIIRTPKGFTGTNSITPSTESPFVDGTLVDTEGKYTLKPEYQGIGAIIE
ncbi:PL29 family lyase N-terminal domain-containing protein [Bacteroides zhangwenhongii]|uniref:PL29 family lyase N-terminal domain-containing protein n=1 Tax=Bacteroides zhangwenhongii TaxID=2650157 RepID=UPI00189BDEE1